MPISYKIYEDIRLVIASGVGVVTPDDMFSYQREVWSREDVAGFDELINMSGVEKIDCQSSQGVQELAELSARMDSKIQSSRLAIVAPDLGSFGLGRMYQAYREMAPDGNKEVRVFKTLDEARLAGEVMGGPKGLVTTTKRESDWDSVGLG